MKRTAGILWVGAILMVAVAVPTRAQAQANDESAQSATIWDGVYTIDQADRGKEIANINCSMCHSAADWGSSAFMTRWSGHSIADLHVHIKDNMPYDAPGRLTAKEYADIIAYMLFLNNVPAGQKELPTATADLDRIEFTAQAPQAHAH